MNRFRIGTGKKNTLYKDNGYVRTRLESTVVVWLPVLSQGHKDRMWLNFWKCDFYFEFSSLLKRSQNFTYELGIYMAIRYASWFEVLRPKIHVWNGIRYCGYEVSEVLCVHKSPSHPTKIFLITFNSSESASLQFKKEIDNDAFLYYFLFPPCLECSESC